MNRSSSLTSLVFLLALAAPLAAQPTTAQTIAQARQFLGGDAALDRVQTLVYRGTFETADKVTGQITITLKKPASQRLEIISDDTRRVTAVNDFEGWERVSRVSNPEEWSMVLIDFNEFRRMRANSWENLFFFNGIERMRGTLVDRGIVQFDGREAHQLVFQYDRDLTYSRYFDPVTGQLYATVNDRGQDIREVGEMIVDGIRFPAEIISRVGDREVMRVRFTEILVNAPVDDQLFEVAPISRGNAPR